MLHNLEGDGYQDQVVANAFALKMSRQMSIDYAQPGKAQVKTLSPTARGLAAAGN